jgi:threonine dehydratase
VIPSHEDLLRARRRLHGLLLPTPLVELAHGVAGAPRVLLKLESRQRTKSFKPRGALNAALAARERGPVTGLVTFSSGNHGQAVALAANELGVPAIVVAPEDVRATKRLAMEALGARVVLRGLTSGERMQGAREVVETTGYTLIPPYDHPDVIAGQSTVAQEILEQAPALDAIVVPVGGGGLISGTALAVDGRFEVVGAEPADADDARRSLAAGSLQRNDRPSASPCDGLRNTCVGDLPWSIIRERVGRIDAVSDDEVAGALRILADHALLPVEPSGAAALAAALSGRLADPSKTVACIVSGGNG